MCCRKPKYGKKNLLLLIFFLDQNCVYKFLIMSTGLTLLQRAVIHGECSYFPAGCGPSGNFFFLLILFTKQKIYFLFVVICQMKKHFFSQCRENTVRLTNTNTVLKLFSPNCKKKVRILSLSDFCPLRFATLLRLQVYRLSNNTDIVFYMAVFIFLLF